MTLQSTHLQVVQENDSYTNTLGEATGADGYYEIYNAAQLYAFANLVNSGNGTINARLMNDIDLSSVCGAAVSWTPIGNSRRFQGTFDGQGHTVSGLYINSSSTSNNVCTGLFGYLYSGGTVKNLNISGTVTVTVTVTITSSSYSYFLYTGGVVGYNSQGTVENCSFNGSVSATLTSTRSNINLSTSSIGGVVGVNYQGTVKNCCHTGTVTGTVTGTASGSCTINAGGVVGNNNEGRVENCYHTGKVSGGDYAGGVVGYSVVGYSNVTTVSNCYFLQDIDTDTSLSGIGNGSSNAGAEPKTSPAARWRICCKAGRQRARTAVFRRCGARRLWAIRRMPPLF